MERKRAGNQGDEYLEVNPYRAPESIQEAPRQTGPDGWAEAPIVVPAYHGLLWLGEAARVIAARPGLWVSALCLSAAVPVAFMLAIGLSLQPFPTNKFPRDPTWAFALMVCLLCFVPFWPVLTGSIACAAHKQRQGEAIRLRDIFAFFRSWSHCFMWAGIGLFVTPFMGGLFSCLVEMLSALISPTVKDAEPIIAFALGVPFIMGNIFIAAAAALHGEWPLRLLVWAGLENMSAFLLNSLPLSLALWAMARLVAVICGLGLASLVTVGLSVLFVGLVALVAYAAVRDIFFAPERVAARSESRG